MDEQWKEFAYTRNGGKWGGNSTASWENANSIISGEEAQQRKQF